MRLRHIADQSSESGKSDCPCRAWLRSGEVVLSENGGQSPKSPPNCFCAAGGSVEAGPMFWTSGGLESNADRLGLLGGILLRILTSSRDVAGTPPASRKYWRYSST